jgi:hypothetical protein
MLPHGLGHHPIDQHVGPGLAAVGVMSMVMLAPCTW